MKKVLLFLMILVAVIGITACDFIHTHSFGEWSVTKNATCTEDGIKTRYCECGEKQSDVLPAIGHNYVDGICSNCDDVMSSQCEHDDPTQIIVVNAVVPTCQKTGLTEGLKCLKCGTMVLPQAIVNTIECIESDWIIDKDSTNTEIGNKHTECTMCGKLFSSAIIVKESKGLDFALNDDKQSYSVTGIGICTDMDIVIPGSHNNLPVTSISNWVLNDCLFIRSVVIPASVTNIGDFALQICTSLKSIEVDSNNQYYKSIDGNLYTKDGKTLIQYATGKEETSFAIPDSVTSIGDYAFRDCSFITSIEIPDSVTSIGDFALCGCTSLISIEIPKSVTSIGDGAFRELTSLTSIEIPKSVTSIGDGLFWHCTYLTSIEVDQNNQYYKSIDGNLYTKDGKTLIQYAIGKEATSFTIPDSVTSIVLFAFANGTSLKSVYIGKSVTSIDQSAFLHCTSLTLYCEANSKPSGWVYYWDNLDYFGGKVSVVWGYEGDKPYVRDGDYIYFGEYPQTIKADDVTITETQDSRGYYLGSDGFYYAMVVATPYDSGYTFSTGVTVTSDTVYYFKIEPIRWRILSIDGKTAFIHCDSIIANMSYQSSVVDDFYTTANGAPDGTYANNFKHSDVRKWLNENFYNTAFNELQREIILTTTVDNSAESIRVHGFTGNLVDINVCEDTEEMIFLLSRLEATNGAYGFAQNVILDSNRQMLTSDYSRATGAFTYFTTDESTAQYNGNGFWWLRSPNYIMSDCAGSFSYDGYDCVHPVDSNRLGIVPALRITL